jgi:hypothetical protein
MRDDSALRSHVIDLLEGGNAHIVFDDVLKDFPVDRAGIRPRGAPHSAWELLEHLRIAQEDILKFSDGPEGYVELRWPHDYWPSSPAPASAQDGNRSVNSVREDLTRFLQLLQNTGRDLFEPFPWGSGQTLLREALLIADHNSYHLGQLMLVRRLLENTQESPPAQ